jgi:tetratricopeptide (TPR) repeat protein
MNTSDRPVFVVGSGRSGTTLLRLLIDTTDDIAIGPETDIVWATLKDIPEPLWSQVKSAEAIIRRESFLGRELQDFGFTEHEFHALIQGADSRKAFLDGFFNSYRTRKGKPRWGDKTPMNLIAIPEILRCYPDAKLVHIHRNPKAVAHSFVKQEFGPDTISDAAHMWYFRTRFIMEQSKCGWISPNVLTIGYEQMLSNPIEVLGTLFSFLEVNAEPAQIASEFHLVSHDGIYRKEMDSALDPSRANHHAYSEQDEIEIETFCADLMSELDYKCSFVETVPKDKCIEREDLYRQWLHEQLLSTPASVNATLIRKTQGQPASYKQHPHGISEPSLSAIELNKLGEKCFERGDQEDAEKHFLLAIQRDPEFPDSYNNLGVLYWHNQKETQAVDYLARGMAIAPFNRDIVQNSAEILKFLGRHNDAASLYTGYLEKYPDDREIQALLRELCSQEKQHARQTSL